MSKNMRLVRSIMAEWERGDFRFVDWAHPHIEYAIADEPGSQMSCGVAAMMRTWREFLDVWDDYRVQARDYRAIDDERVLVEITVQGRGRTSGLDIATMAAARGSANVFHVRGGKVTRLLAYFDRDQALADVGLATEGG